MKILHLLIIVSIFQFTLIGQDIAFRNPLTKRVEMIDIKSKKYYYKNEALIEPVLIGKLNFENITISDFPSTIHVNTFLDSHNTLFLSISGTGQLYKLTKTTFRRLDKTYYRGFNFGASKFMRNDTLFSFGGMGFWRVNNVLTFFDFKQKEWEYQFQKNTGPEAILVGLSGLSENKFYTVTPSQIFQPKITDEHEVFQYDLNSKIWKKLGTLNFVSLFGFEVKPENTVWINGGILFLDINSKIYFGDIQNNKLYESRGSKLKFFNHKFDFFENKTHIFSHRKDYSNRIHKSELDSLTKGDFKNEFVEINQLYKPIISDSIIIQYYSIFILLGTLIIILIVIFIRKRYFKKKVYLFDILPDGSEYLIKQLVGKGEGYQFTSNEIIELSLKTFKTSESQRLFRSKFLNQFNNYFSNTYKIQNAIERVNSKDDKRYVLYFFKKEAYLVLVNYMKTYKSN